MLKYVLFAQFVLASCVLHAQGAAALKSTLDSALVYCQQRYFFSREVNWDQVRELTDKHTGNLKTSKDLLPAFQALINGIRDHHGGLIDAHTYHKMVMFNEWDKDRRSAFDQRPRNMTVYKAVNEANDHFEYELLPDGVAYLKIPGFVANTDINMEAFKIRSAIKTLAEKKAKYWIVDLRFNGGGNMNPMLAGLAPLLGEGLISSFVYANDEILTTNEIKNGEFFSFGQQVGADLPKYAFKTQPKVAVLTSMWTSSSGEIVAVSFKGRPQTRFFGEASAGLTTATGWAAISPDFILSISEAIYADRSGHKYFQNVPVDEVVPVEVSADKSQDKGIKAAIKWLKT